jgi:hypothetical protein
MKRFMRVFEYGVSAPLSYGFHYPKLGRDICVSARRTQLLTNCLSQSDRGSKIRESSCNLASLRKENQFIIFHEGINSYDCLRCFSRGLKVIKTLTFRAQRNGGLYNLANKWRMKYSWTPFTAINPKRVSALCRLFTDT